MKLPGNAGEVATERFACDASSLAKGRRVWRLGGSAPPAAFVVRLAPASRTTPPADIEHIRRWASQLTSPRRRAARGCAQLVAGHGRRPNDAPLMTLHLFCSLRWKRQLDRENPTVPSTNEPRARRRQCHLSSSTRRPTASAFSAAA